MAHRIQWKQTKGRYLPPNTVWVGSRSKWRCPYKPSYFHVRGVPGYVARQAEYLRQVLEHYHVYLTKARPELAVAAKVELVGQDLACRCPLYDKDGCRTPCHADILLQMANGWSDDETSRLLPAHREKV